MNRLDLTYANLSKKDYIELDSIYEIVDTLDFSPENVNKEKLVELINIINYKEKALLEGEHIKHLAIDHINKILVKNNLPTILIDSK